MVKLVVVGGLNSFASAWDYTLVEAFLLSSSLLRAEGGSLSTKSRQFTKFCGHCSGSLGLLSHPGNFRGAVWHFAMNRCLVHLGTKHLCWASLLNSCFYRLTSLVRCNRRNAFSMLVAEVAWSWIRHAPVSPWAWLEWLFPVGEHVVIESSEYPENKKVRNGTLHELCHQLNYRIRGKQDFPMRWHATTVKDLNTGELSICNSRCFTQTVW